MPTNPDPAPIARPLTEAMAGRFGIEPHPMRVRGVVREWFVLVDRSRKTKNRSKAFRSRAEAEALAKQVLLWERAPLEAQRAYWVREIKAGEAARETACHRVSTAEYTAQSLRIGQARRALTLLGSTEGVS